VSKHFIVVTGLPGSGKSTLARALAPRLGLPVLDKDDILDRLFRSKGIGDAQWRRALSRESDLLLQAEATASEGAILVSHWLLPGMPFGSGTPTDWIPQLAGRLVNLHCECDAEIAAERFARRVRHPGHLDGEKSPAEILASIREIASFDRLDMGARVDVRTPSMPELDAVAAQIRSAFESL